MTHIESIAKEYFIYMAKNYPVMCSSDEFYFFPRAKESAGYSDVLDSLGEEKIKENLSYVTKLKSSLGPIRPDGLEEEIDLALLKESMSTFLREFGEVRVWQKDPMLYRKIVLLGKGKARRRQVPRLMREAKRNLKKEVFKADREYLERMLEESFSCARSLEEIFDIARAEYSATIKRISKQEMASYKLDVKNEKELVGLYAGEIERLKLFFRKKDVITVPKMPRVKVKPTPDAMKPIRASASYNAGEACFYITADSFRNNVHAEYIFVTAHETYPGHHLLDSIRNGLTNPIRAQIESPLFYEGWASYAEGLVDELGYVKDPRQKMVGLRRRAWRAVRAMLDAGGVLGKMNGRRAGEMLKGLGYASGTVKSMIRHYALTSGYQLCYTIGKFEIERLKNKFAPKIGLKKFHDLVLSGGEIPFDLLERRIEENI